MTTIDSSARLPSRVSGGDHATGHLEELRADPIGLMERVRSECGDVGIFDLAGRDVVLLSGADTNELFFRAPEEVLDQAEAYPFMTPIFGEGVVFDAPPERRREMLHNQALRDKFMRGHAATIATEVESMVAAWGDEGEIDLLDWFAELTIHGSQYIAHRRFLVSFGKIIVKVDFNRKSIQILCARRFRAHSLVSELFFGTADMSWYW
jgi:sterol 14-demethylase